MDISELVKRWPPAAIARLEEQPRVCEDCGNGTDLGHKCRACYLQWSKLVWQDIPNAFRDLQLVARQLNIVGDKERKAIADVATGKATRGIDGRSAELYAIVKRVLAGPYGPQLESKLQAIQNASEEGKKGRKSAGSMEVD